MNQLSWLLYWADTLPSLASAFIGVFAVLGVLLLLFSFIHVAVNDTYGKINWRGVKRASTLGVLSITLSLFGNLVPSKQTFYLIAASEAGESVLKTPEFDKIRGVINKYLDEALDTRKPEKDD